ncbi:hypothetical protein [Bacillus thermotolerans]|uniref:Uncharacterized protein n=1 Tax=Bacillus thermotolerans TaxID=1221996 RepID=A0A0F5I6F2_BACTR|nr:hypothetical protein [Bacillus thermotolerans]KKB36169.1 hypothetical protein QY97_01261 [Bacillus thermotolerans]KKB41214.1 hypothetical protein QY95_00921 [Bacillus thermotolerans]KKB44076.1 hypothetical protein QY96_03702 [Bacillus thermotolerans]
MNMKKLLTYGLVAAVVVPKVKEKLETQQLRKEYQNAHRVRMNNNSILGKISAN